MPEKKIDQVDRRLTSFQTQTEANFVEVNDRFDTLETTVRRHGVEISSRQKAAEAASSPSSNFVSFVVFG